MFDRTVLTELLCSQVSYNIIAWFWNIKVLYIVYVLIKKPTCQTTGSRLLTFFLKKEGGGEERIKVFTLNIGVTNILVQYVTGKCYLSNRTLFQLSLEVTYF